MFRKLLVSGALLAALASCSSDGGGDDDLGFPPTDLARTQATDCSGYPSQAAAQAALRENPSDPNNLDPDDDGIACENNPAPYDRTPVNRQTGTTAVPAATTTTTQPPVSVERSTEEMVNTGPNDWIGWLSLGGVVVFALGIALRGRRSSGVHWLDR